MKVRTSLWRFLNRVLSDLLHADSLAGLGVETAHTSRKPLLTLSLQLLLVTNPNTETAAAKGEISTGYSFSTSMENKEGEIWNWEAMHLSGIACIRESRQIPYYISHFQMFSFFLRKQSNVAYSVSLSHSEQVEIPWGKKKIRKRERKVKNPVKTWLKGNSSSLI